MRKIYFVFLSVLTFLKSQDNCSSALSLPVNSSCMFTAGNTTGATPSFAGCVGNADDDVWYSFVATATSHSITVQGSASFDAVLEVFSGNCSGLTSLGCVDNTLNGGTESGIFSGLTIGQAYYLRVYHYFSGSGSGSFSICVSQAPPAPSNNICGNAIALTVNNSCNYTSATSFGASQSFSGCAGNANDDVWFTFTATNYTHLIQVVPNSTMDAVFQLYNGSSCSSLNSLNCVDNAFSGGTESLVALGLQPGSTYYLRVYDYYSNPGGTFSICVSGPSAGPSQPNDNPCSAIPLPPVTSNCNYLTFSNIGATSTPTTIAPAPFSCAGGSSPFTGGFSASTKDVWFSIVVPSNGKVFITPRPNMGTGWISDGVMALYSGPSCSSLTQIACSDDYTSYPGSANDLLPYIAATGLTPGSTIYLRYWGFSASQGSFGICVQSPTNDNCSNSLYICDLNGYAASTSAAYTPDRPSNMRGNAEQPVTYSYTPGTNTGGIFGQGGPWGSGSPFFDVQINNNSWVMFTAATSTASFKVDIANCWVGNYPSGGLQMQIFSAQGPCTTFTPTSDFKEGSSTFTINAVNLTTGNNYYLMIDGFAGDICNYTITALTGVSFPNISSPKDSICFGQNIVLSGPNSASSYTWLPGNQNTQTISVSPGATTTYTLIAGGVCGFKQYLTKTIYVKNNPTVQINGTSQITLCAGGTTTLYASGANSYTWNTGAISPSIVVSPTSNATYSVTGNIQGCTNQTNKTVTVYPTPTINISSSSSSICVGNQATISASGGVSYTWNPGSFTGPSVTVSPTANTVFSVTGSNSSGCSQTKTLALQVLPNPTVSVTSATLCLGQNTIITASGASSYSWSSGQTTQSISVTPSATTQYTITGIDLNGCSAKAVASVQILALPNITVNSGTLCSGQSLTLTANGAVSYTWNTNQNGSQIIITPTSNSSYTVTGSGSNGCSNVAVSNVTVFNPPQLISTPSVSPSNCSASTGSITNITVSGSSPFTYTWTNTLSQTVANTSQLLNQPAGTYNLYVKDNTGCVSQFGPYQIINPNAPAAPGASVNASQVCAGQSIILSAGGSGNLIYNWSGPNGFTSNQQNPTIANSSPAQSGIYSVFTTSAGCSGPASQVTVIVHPLPNPIASSSQSVYCQSDAIHLFVTSASSYSWSGPNGFSSNLQNPVMNNAGISASGLYQVVVSNTAGCTSSATVQILVNPQPNPVVSAGAGTVCEGQSFTLSAVGGTSFLWQGPNGFLSTQQNPVIQPVLLSAQGIYTLTATNSFGCQKSQTVTLSVYPIPSVTLTTQQPSVCVGGSILINATATPSAQMYQWTGPGGIISNQASLNVQPFQISNAGVYTVLVTSNQGCQRSSTIAVSAYSVPVINIQLTPTTVCSGQPVSISSSGALSYTWTGPSGFNSTLSAIQWNQVQLTQSGNYTVTGTDLNGCIGQQSVNLLVTATPSLNTLSGDTTCSGRVLNLQVQFIPTIAIVNWYADAGLNQLLNSGSFSYQPNLNSNGTYTYFAQAMNGGCVSSVIPVVAQYYNLDLMAIAQPSDGAAPLTVQFSGSVSSGASVAWWFGDGNTANILFSQNVYQQPGTYVATVSASEGICTVQHTLEIQVRYELGVIPELLTPNDDGKNDVFEIKGLEYYPDNELEIYNRWGNLVYSAQGYKNDWDGKPNGPFSTGNGRLPTGYYFYILKLNDKAQRNFKGFLRLEY